MSSVLGAVPGLVWIGAALIGVAIWADDVRAFYVALFCLLISTVQLFRRPSD